MTKSRQYCVVSVLILFGIAELVASFMIYDASRDDKETEAPKTFTASRVIPDMQPREIKNKDGSITYVPRHSIV